MDEEVLGSEIVVDYSAEEDSCDMKILPKKTKNEELFNDPTYD